MTCDPSRARNPVYAELQDEYEASTAVERLARIRELHSPTPIPDGQQWMGSNEPGATPCAGCRTGDPYLDEQWPCQTRRIADGLPEIGPEVPVNEPVDLLPSLRQRAVDRLMARVPTMTADQARTWVAEHGWWKVL